MCSVLYGTQTVLLLLVSRQVGLGAQGYGYMFAAIGAGGLLGTALAGRVSRLESRPVLAATLALAGLPTLLLAVVRWPAAAIVLTGLTGMGALLVEILTETTLQRELDEDVFGRAYGIAFPAAIAGIVVGSVLAPGLAALLGASGALIAVDGTVLGYALLVWPRPPCPPPSQCRRPQRHNHHLPPSVRNSTTGPELRSRRYLHNEVDGLFRGGSFDGTAPRFFHYIQRADKSWATWIASTLEETAYTTTIQACDFQPGDNFLAAMDNALAACRHTLRVLSPHYLSSVFTPAEWTAAYRQALLVSRGASSPSGWPSAMLSRCSAR